MRSEEQYENFILHVEWRHMESGGNSGVFAWSTGTVAEGRRLPKGLEVQMLELDWVKLHKQKDGTLPPIAYVHWRTFWGRRAYRRRPTIPAAAAANRSRTAARARASGTSTTWSLWTAWFKLSVNGKFVNGLSNASVKKGYLCLESEGAEIHFRSIRILELPPGITSAEQTAPVVKD